ncbi:type III polyketide synthase [Ornithinibacillus bavariensis]|uniref:Chalcone synthase n=1 Tax=Ornithinibacillus bavariensis TaxID=545502 RepID=A0A919XD32_9BACI|nr:3-oxoacyl-[acyl-carrier-protein] synthase III C-terminal domain-containing protein [Ornithinibacillus bavariensis]GIO28415.1 putative chalcone synthase [Ornithinibacillus bavariensis]
MAIIRSVGTGIPKYEISQTRVKDLVQHIFSYSERVIERLLPVFDNAAIKHRQLVVPEEWFLSEHSFEERNRLYHQLAIQYSLEAMDHCLEQTTINYDEIDMLVFVSSTGVSTPSIDTFLMNKRPFRRNVERMPLWGLGCAGGAIGLSRVHNWLKANPEKTALLVNCEICSLTFQRGDHKKSNIIGTALFGDGISAVLLIGEKSKYREEQNKLLPMIKSYSSYTKKDSTDVMGWGVVNSGFEVVFSKSIPALVETIWKDHMLSFMEVEQVEIEDIKGFIAHPGGKKVLDAMKQSLHIHPEKLKYSEKVLNDHGNMSSATVQYVLQRWLKEDMKSGDKGIVCALGPGFSSEIILVEWDK